MGRLRREINKKVKSSKPPFDVWYDSHREEIGNVTGHMEQEKDLGEVKVKSRITYFVVIATGILLIVAAIVLAALFHDRQSETQPQIPDLTFGEESVDIVPLNEEELNVILERIPQLTKLTNITATSSVYQVDNSVVMSLVSGELETANDFYLVEARIVYNDNFIFLTKWEYDELESETSIGDTTILYESKGMDDFGMNVFFVLLETDTELVYWKVSCFEGLFDDWLEYMLA